MYGDGRVSSRSPARSASRGSSAANPSSFELFDTLTFWAVNVTSAFMLSAAHNVLYFVLDWRTPIMHFLHFVCTFVFLAVKVAVTRAFRELLTRNGRILPPPIVHWRMAFALISPALLTQSVLCLLSAYVHSQNRAGELYLLRIFDFLATITALKANQMLMGSQMRQVNQVWSLTLPVAVAASLSWLEFGHIEFDSWTLVLAPIHGVALGVHVVVLQSCSRRFQAYCQSVAVTASKTNNNSVENSTNSSIDANFADAIHEEFFLYYCGSMTTILSIPALISYNGSVVSYDASWESIDYILMSMSVVFMASFKYSELWLLTHLKTHHFCVFEHTKFFMASCGQWFLQNMAHASIYAACGKGLFIVSLLRYLSGFDISLTPAPKKQSEA